MARFIRRLTMAISTVWVSASRPPALEGTQFPGLHFVESCLSGAGRDKPQNSMYGSRSHDAVIHVYNAAGNVIETHEHTGDFKEPYVLTS
jgi:hypothetical protein